MSCPYHAEWTARGSGVSAVPEPDNPSQSAVRRIHRSSLLRLRAAAIVFAALLPAAPAATEEALIARGRAIAEENCSRCHAVGRTGASPNPRSPPFRTLNERYPLAQLEEALGEGIMVGHEGLEMPHFQLRPAQIEALIAYLAAVQDVKK
jgi:cytochrome c